MEETIVGPDHKKKDRAEPDPEWIRGDCPYCGAPTVSNAWYCGGRGYLILIHCWNALGEEPTCTYQRSL